MTLTPTTITAIVTIVTVIINVALSLTGITGVLDCSLRAGAAQVQAAAANVLR
jgi:hypothetical protein